MGPKLPNPGLGLPMPPCWQAVSWQAPASCGAAHVCAGPTPGSRMGTWAATSPDGPPNACKRSVPLDGPEEPSETSPDLLPHAPKASAAKDRKAPPIANV